MGNLSWRRGGLALIVAGAAVVLGPAAASAQTPVPLCGEATSPAADGAAARRPAVLALEPGQRTTLKFGRDRGERNIQLRFGVTECQFAEADAFKPGDPPERKPRLAGRNTPVVDQDSNTLRTPDECRATPRGSAAPVEVDCVRVAVTIESRTLVVAELFVHPAARALPGTYETTVVVVDPRAAPLQVPITVTLQYNRPELLASSVFVPIVGFGWLLVWWKASLAGAKEPPWRWWLKFGNLVAVLAGLTAARAVWAKTYLGDPAFGSDLVDLNFALWPIMSSQWVTLVTLMGTAFVGAVTAAAVAGDQVRGSTDSPEGGGPLKQRVQQMKAARAAPPEGAPEPPPGPPPGAPPGPPPTG